MYNHPSPSIINDSTGGGAGLAIQPSTGYKPRMGHEKSDGTIRMEHVLPDGEYELVQPSVRDVCVIRKGLLSADGDNYQLRRVANAQSRQPLV